eukprot:symbB.v1.2.011866.t2/scaffold807.1/size160841/11
MYRGEWHQDGWPSGHGELFVAGKDGGTFRGTWEQGKLEGEGEFISTNGGGYSGQWSAGVKQGQGTQSWPRSGWINDAVARAMLQAHYGEPILQLLTLPQQRRLLNGKTKPAIPMYTTMVEAVNTENLQSALFEVAIAVSSWKSTEKRSAKWTWQQKVWHILDLKRQAQELQDESEHCFRRRFVVETLKAHRILDNKESLESKLERMNDFWPQFHQFCRSSEAVAQLPHPAPEAEGEAEKATGKLRSSKSLPSLKVDDGSLLYQGHRYIGVKGAEWKERASRRWFHSSFALLFMAIGPMDWTYCEMYIVNACSIPAHKLNEVDQWGGSLAANLPWCSHAKAQYLEGDWHFGCLPHVNQSLFCCGDELVELREHSERVLIYRKRALNDAADQMDSFRDLSDVSKKLHGSEWCAAKDRILEYLWLAFSEARVLAIGGLEVLRFGLQDLSCQVCWASERDRSGQIARVVHRDLQAVLIRLQQLRAGLPPWEPCLPSWWQSLVAPFNVVNVSVRSGGTVDRMLSLRQWMESIAVSMTAVAGEFQSLSYILHSDSLLSDAKTTPLEGRILEVPVPRAQPGRVAVLLHECAQLSYPKIDFVTVGKQDCTSLWRKFPYASARTSVMLPDASLRVSCDRKPAESDLAQLARLLEADSTTLGITGCSIAPKVTDFDPKVLQKTDLQSSKALVFVCLHSTFCGGHGDRLFGLLSTYLAALLSNRSFFIDMRSPIPLSSLLHPKRPWPAISGACMTYRWTSAEDATSLEEDLRHFMQDTSEVICVASNLRLFKSLLSYDVTGRFTRPALLSGLFRDLFALAALPTSLLHAFQRRLGQRPLLGIHFRAGNETTWSDPGRHSLGELDLALSCAAQVEMQLELVDAAWLLASDSLKLRQHPAVMQLHEAGKIVYLEERPTHIDRSSPDVDGIFQSWALWWVLAFETDALLLSHSNFGWSAAEIGQRRAFHFPSCRPADVTSP